jgi:hypothetical protein
MRSGTTDVPRPRWVEKLWATFFVTADNALPVASTSTSKLLALAFLKIIFAFEEASSIGLKSGE